MSDRIAIRKAKRSDLPLIEPWYEDVVRTVHGGRTPPDEPRLGDRARSGGLLVIESKDSHDALGFMDCKIGWPSEGWVATDFIALAPERRGWGYGSEALRAFESRHRKARFMAEIDTSNGLALYFWLRMGYRPARADEVFWRAPDGGGIIAMIRLPD